ncbi:MAG: hypothetical protein QOI13_2091 [Paraburkholderia sp.]|jgi:hypothetical protein|nr:hypothetical protein [Paraburkholderia sp.]
MATLFPYPLARIESVSNIERRGARWFFSISGTQAWCCEFSQGLCVAINVECVSPGDAWIEKASLWLASVRATIDDALLIDIDQWWLVRRYEMELESVQWEVLLNQQVALADWLASGHAGSDLTSQPGRAGRWA